MSNSKFIPTWIAAAVVAMGATLAQAQPAPAAGQQSAQPVQAAAGPQSGAAGQHGPARHGVKQGKRAHDPAKRAAALKQKLNLTAAQQGAWDQYLAAMMPPAAPNRTDLKAEHEAMAKLPVPQRIEARQKRHAEMTAHMHARDEATKTFYAQLSPEQQKVFDVETARHGKPGQGAHHMPKGKHGAKKGQPPEAPATN